MYSVPTELYTQMLLLLFISSYCCCSQAAVVVVVYKQLLSLLFIKQLLSLLLQAAAVVVVYKQLLSLLFICVLCCVIVSKLWNIIQLVMTGDELYRVTTHSTCFTEAAVLLKLSYILYCYVSCQTNQAIALASLDTKVNKKY